MTYTDAKGPTDTAPLRVLDLAGTLELLRRADGIGRLEQILRDTVRSLIGAHALVLRDGDFCHYVAEDAIGPLWKGQKFPMAACISGWAMIKRQTVCIPDIRFDKRIPQDLYEGTFVRSLVMTPLGTEPPIGALGVYWSHFYAARFEEVVTIEALASAIGETIKRAREAEAEPRLS
jgi:hypothetical protein